MKKLKNYVKLAGVLAGVITISLTRIGVTYASSLGVEVEHNQGERLKLKYSEWYRNDEIVYPINIFDDEWNKLETNEEMVEITKVPDELLEGLSTAELLKLVEDYPLLGNIYCYGLSLDGLHKLADECDALGEFLERDDSLDIAMKRYEELKINCPDRPDLEKLETDEAMTEYVNKVLDNDDLLKRDMDESGSARLCELLELLMVDMTDAEKLGEIVEMVDDKLDEKAECVFYNYESTSTFVSVLSDDMECVQNNARIGVARSGTQKTITYNGIKIVVSEDRGGTPIGIANVETIMAPYKDNDEVELIAVGLDSYNCHSYAWLKDKYPSDFRWYWLNSVPSELMKKYYYKSSEPKSAGTIAYTAQHSAVIVDPNNTKLDHGKLIKDPIVRAKWGSGPIVKSPMSEGLYAMSSQDVEAFYTIIHKK